MLRRGFPASPPEALADVNLRRNAAQISFLNQLAIEHLSKNFLTRPLGPFAIPSRPD